MPDLILTRGLPASGKSTWAKAWVAAAETHSTDGPGRVRVSRDDLRLMLFGPGYRTPVPACEKLVSQAERFQAEAALKSGCDVIIDAMNLRPKYLRGWQELAEATGAAFVTREFPIGIDEAIRRDASRERSVGEDVIRNQSRFLAKGGGFLPLTAQDAGKNEPAGASTPYTPKPGAPKAVMVDIDGTVALMKKGAGARSPFDWHRVGEDEPNRPVIEAVHAAADAGFTVIFCSGRDNSCRAETRVWLDEHVMTGGGLFMRPAGDYRRDSVVKVELFDRYIRDHYNVRYVLDDRKQVVEAWRGLGLTVMQVAEGDF
ncbi:AAA family ATPase [Saccharopolyspora shandongensis]|uniref:phosphatase domain-containing protein n=1 Tax=Saccharopolyspora shandongensis TaxID=418495 RepID=UPI0033D28CDF